MAFKRLKTRQVRIGRAVIGAGNPVLVQSMTNTRTSDVRGTVSQIKRLADAGCEIVRCGVPDMESAKALKAIKKKVKIPLVADIHYDYRLALEAIKSGADKIRINPGNIGSADKVSQVILAAKERGVAIRVGVNAGSLKKIENLKLKTESGNRTADAMVASLLEYIEFFEMHDFTDIVVSLKASDVVTTIEAYKLFSQMRDYPLHIGVTEAGTELGGTIKTAAGLGILLYEGLGDTLRVSLTAEPEKEVYVAYRLLDALGMRKRGAEIVSCPTCARTEIDVIKLAHDVEKAAMGIKKPVKIAVMGCSVNGPGEAAHADIGVSGGRGVGLIFRKGKILKKVPKKDLMKEFNKELKKLI
ncbi:MAG TPA: flavodoxin-dependent (E)-4-hydroxy-3-methylbut-2-enyl-diphosphate synthase [Candidatus Goldiibacteriota bacterium]|nr:flavodoxin-dependent (E)-4-hydroxy-3-methylbut-2-enyl-diphosphate synthase [Candidatus Goldiibacteriota bacterium]